MIASEILYISISKKLSDCFVWESFYSFISKKEYVLTKTPLWCACVLQTNFNLFLIILEIKFVSKFLHIKKMVVALFSSKKFRCVLIKNWTIFQKSESEIFARFPKNHEDCLIWFIIPKTPLLNKFFKREIDKKVATSACSVVIN